MLGLTADVVIGEARKMLDIDHGTVLDETDEYHRAVIDFVSLLLFDNYPGGVAVELARTAIMSGGW